VRSVQYFQNRETVYTYVYDKHDVNIITGAVRFSIFLNIFIDRIIHIRVCEISTDETYRFAKKKLYARAFFALGRCLLNSVVTVITTPLSLVCQKYGRITQQNMNTTDSAQKYNIQQ